MKDFGKYHIGSYCDDNKSIEWSCKTFESKKIALKELYYINNISINNKNILFKFIERFEIYLDYKRIQYFLFTDVKAKSMLYYKDNMIISKKEYLSSKKTRSIL